MCRFHSICILLFLTALSGTAATTPSLTELEQERAAIDAELNQLAHYSLRSGMGSIGYRSRSSKTPDHFEWIQIDLKKESPIDQIVLVPAIWRDFKTGFSAEGFPIEFNVLAGTAHTTEILASFTEKDPLLPRIAPLIIPCSTTASWVRIEVTKLSSRAIDGKYNLELAEFMIFNGPKNIALHQKVTVTHKSLVEGNARKRAFLVDGFVPYLMDAAQGEMSTAYIGIYQTNEQPTFTLDLGKPYLLDSINLHSIDLDDTIPHATPTDYAIPRRICIEGALEPDFSDAVILTDFHAQSVFDTGPIMMCNLEPTRCQYVRLTAREPYIYPLEIKAGSRVGFAEIELISSGKNVAQGKLFTIDVAQHHWRLLSSLTDGRNLYGNILPIRTWINELARRHDLELRRPQIINALNERYTQQKKALKRMYILSALLLIAASFTVMFERLRRTRGELKLKERFAADLHDELGANLHTIGLLSDLADGSKENPQELSRFHERIRTVTERTGIAVRHCTDMFEANELYTGLIEDMQRTAQRIMAGVEHDIMIEGGPCIEQLKASTLFDLFLFYKEGLTNISRHADASHFSTHLSASDKQISLLISDNGRGLNKHEQEIPSSLKRRARLLGANVIADTPSEGGTRITLTLQIRRKHLRKK